jgi:hypothetical protein
MFEKIGRAAEKAAGGVSLSRRGFLGRLGQTALSAAGVLAGMAALSCSASAGNGKNILNECGCFTKQGGTTIWYECGKCSWHAHFCKVPGNEIPVGTC